MHKLFEFVFDDPLGKLAAGVIALVALVGAFAWDQRSIGADRAIAKVEKKNAQSVKRANDAGARSRDPGTAGVLDPYTRND